MSKYTTELRYICETEYGLKESVGSTKVDEILTDVAPKIFNFDFPIFDENYRLVLEKKILRHFYTREIGLETYGLWKLKLEDKMNEIMPYLNKFYAMYVQDVNPLYNFDLKREHKGKGKREEDLSGSFYNHADTDGDSNSNANQLYSDTPQNGLTDVQSGKYLTNATINSDSGHTEGHSYGDGWNKGDNTIKDENEYYETVQGRSSVMVGEAWKKFREGFVNVDKMLFKELEVLFMQLW